MVQLIHPAEEEAAAGVRAPLPSESPGESTFSPTSYSGLLILLPKAEPAP